MNSLKNKLIGLIFFLMFLTIIISSFFACKYYNSLNQEKEQKIKLEEKLNQSNVAVDKLEKNNKEQSEVLKKKDKELKEIQKKYYEELKPVSFDCNNIRTKSNATVRDMTVALKNTGLQGLESAYVEAEKKYGVNAIALASLTIEESGWGNSARAKNQNNLSGFEVYSDDSVGKIFDSKEESILTTAKILSRDYLDSKGIYHKGCSLKDINFYYSASPYWASNITSIAKDLVSKINS